MKSIDFYGNAVICNQIESLLPVFATKTCHPDAIDYPSMLDYSDSASLKKAREEYDAKPDAYFWLTLKMVSGNTYIHGFSTRAAADTAKEEFLTRLKDVE